MLNAGKYIVIRITASTLLLAFICFGAYAQEWHFKKEEDGIRVYTANTENSDYKSVKVEFDVRTTFTQLTVFLMDVNKIHEWVYANKVAWRVKTFQPNEFAFYAEVSAPWPCANRDYIAHIKIAQPSAKLLTIDSYGDPALVPEKKGIVRVKRSVAHWEITAQGNGLLHIVYTVSFDPGGSIPAWLTNMFVTKGPLETFEQLKSRVNLPEYQGTRLDFIKD